MKTGTQQCSGHLFVFILLLVIVVVLVIVFYYNQHNNDHQDVSIDESNENLLNISQPITREINMAIHAVNASRVADTDYILMRCDGVCVQCNIVLLEDGYDLVINNMEKANTDYMAVIYTEFWKKLRVQDVVFTIEKYKTQISCVNDLLHIICTEYNGSVLSSSNIGAYIEKQDTTSKKTTKRKQYSKKKKDISPRKYYLSVLGVFKNEGHIMKEWIDHYILHGVDHIYIIKATTIC